MILCRRDFLEASTCKQWMCMRLCGPEGHPFYMLFRARQWGECPDERAVESRSQHWKSSSTALHITSERRKCAIFVRLAGQRAPGSCLSWTQHWHIKSVLPYLFLCGFQVFMFVQQAFLPSESFSQAPMIVFIYTIIIIYRTLSNVLS